MRILILLLIFSTALGATTRSLPNTNALDRADAITIAEPTRSYIANDPTTSTDPFSSKTNKYAESNNLLVISETDGFYIAMSASTAASPVVDAVANSASSISFYVPKDQERYLTVNPAMRYVRVINASASAVVHVTEVY